MTSPGFEPGEVHVHRMVSRIQQAMINGDNPAAAKIIDSMTVADLRNAFCIMAQCWCDVVSGLDAVRLRRALALDAISQAAADTPQDGTA